MSKSPQLAPLEFSIPLTVSHTFQSFRLLELPDELFTLVSGGAVSRLYLKSSAPSVRSFPTSKDRETPRTKAAEYVHLCSEDLEKTWTVRQVSTSNEVYIVQPCWQDKDISEDTVMNDDITVNEKGLQAVAVTAIAKADSLLELLPTAVDVVTNLERRLPSYNMEQLNTAQSRSHDLPDEQEEDLKAQIFEDIPAPNTTIQRVWRELCVSRMSSTQVDMTQEYFIPKSDVLIAAWNAVIESFDARGGGNQEMEKRDFEADDTSLNELVTVSEALWTRLCTDESSRLDRGTTSTWLGQTLLREATATSTAEYPYEVSTFLAKWADSLPRAWAEDAELAKLGTQSFELGNVDGVQMIRSSGKYSHSDYDSEATRAQAPPDTGKRKWHEKFREQRNTKK